MPWIRRTSRKPTRFASSRYASTAEATDRAGYQAAEQVIAALTGGVVSSAVNVPAISAEDMEVLEVDSAKEVIIIPMKQIKYISCDATVFAQKSSDSKAKTG